MIEYLGNDIFRIGELTGNSQYMVKFYRGSVFSRSTYNFFRDLTKALYNRKEDMRNKGIEINIPLLHRVYSVVLILCSSGLNITSFRLEFENKNTAWFQVIYENKVEIRLEFTSKTENIAVVIEFEEKDKVMFWDLSLSELMEIVKR